MHKMCNDFLRKHFRPLRTEYFLRLGALLLRNHENEALRPSDVIIEKM